MIDLSHVTCRMKFSQLLEQIEQIFCFLYKHLFQGNEDVRKPFQIFNKLFIGYFVGF